MHFDLVSNKDVFIFLDLKMLNKLFNNQESLFDVIKYELMGIFKNFEHWKYFIFSLKNKITTHESNFEYIMKILGLLVSNNSNINKLLIVINHYSEIYCKINCGIKSIKEKYFKEKENCICI